MCVLGPYLCSMQSVCPRFQEHITIFSPIGTNNFLDSNTQKVLWQMLYFQA